MRMPPLRVRFTIRAPVNAVFGLYTDAGRLQEWQPGLRGIREQTGALDRPGTTYVLEQPGPELRILVTRVERPRLHEQLERVPWYEWLSIARFDPSPGPTTRLTVERSFTIPGRLGWLLTPYVSLVGWLIARSEFARLKALAERDEGARRAGA